MSSFPYRRRRARRCSARAAAATGRFAVPRDTASAGLSAPVAHLLRRRDRCREKGDGTLDHHQRPARRDRPAARLPDHAHLGAGLPPSRCRRLLAAPAPAAGNHTRRESGRRRRRTRARSRRPPPSSPRSSRRTSSTRRAIRRADEVRVEAAAPVTKPPMASRSSGCASSARTRGVRQRRLAEPAVGRRLRAGDQVAGYTVKAIDPTGITLLSPSGDPVPLPLTLDKGKAGTAARDAVRPPIVPGGRPAAALRRRPLRGRRARRCGRVAVRTPTPPNAPPVPPPVQPQAVLANRSSFRQRCGRSSIS